MHASACPLGCASALMSRVRAPMGDPLLPNTTHRSPCYRHAWSVLHTPNPSSSPTPPAIEQVRIPTTALAPPSASLSPSGSNRSYVPSAAPPPVGGTSPIRSLKHDYGTPDRRNSVKFLGKEAENQQLLTRMAIRRVFLFLSSKFASPASCGVLFFCKSTNGGVGGESATAVDAVSAHTHTHLPGVCLYILTPSPARWYRPSLSRAHSLLAILPYTHAHAHTHTHTHTYTQNEPRNGGCCGGQSILPSPIRVQDIGITVTSNSTSTSTSTTNRCVRGELRSAF